MNGAIAYDINYDEYQADGNSYPYLSYEPQPPEGYLYLLQMTSTGSWSGDPMCSSSIVPPVGNVGVGMQFLNAF
jgi:hypothetical protein